MILSVVIPVYNVKAHLRHCLDSVIAATARVGGTEIICVDDGSTDGSSEILAEYALGGGLRVLSEEHANAGVARNRGMDEARGRYLYFCDGDDFMEPEMLEELVEIAERDHSDVVCTGNQVLSNATGKIVRIDRLQSANLTYGLIVSCGVTVWNKLFRREYVMREGLRFEDVECSNDVRFVALALLLTDRLSVSEQSHYVYRQGRAGSLQTRTAADPLSFANSFALVREEMRRRQPGGGSWTTMLANAILTHFRYNLDVLRQNGHSVSILADALCGRYFELFELGVPQLVNRIVRAPDRMLLLVVSESRRMLLAVRTRLEEREAKLRHVWHWHEHHRVQKEMARAKVRALEERLSDCETELAGLRQSLEYRVGHAFLLPLRFLQGVMRCR